MAKPSPQPDRSSLAYSQSRTIFVGRQREMAELMAALDDALSGQSRLVMLVGEPGIGKTRTAQELASHAEGRGVQVLWGSCYEEAGAPPYWPWVQPIRSYVKQRNPERLHAEMGPGAADIAEIVPEVRAELPGLETPPALEPEAARFRLFDSLTTFLKNASQSQPLMLVLDDLHWADKPSLLLLEFLARQMADCRLLVVGCYRDMELSRQHPLSESLAQLSREPVFRRQTLRGLNQEDTGPFVEATVGVPVSHELADALYSHTEGNPFFLNEVIRLLADQGDLVERSVGCPRRIRVPEGVREVIGRRLNRLSQHCNRILQTASIVGREFDFGLLNALDHGSDEGDLLTAVEQAVGAYLIEEVPGAGERYRFTHALIQETLAEELTTSRRVRLHAQIAETLEELYGDRVEVHAAELAHHFAEAEPMLGPDKLVGYSLLAGERALATYAFEEALTQFQRGLGATQGQVIDAKIAALLFGLGRAQVAMFQPEEARDSLGRAFDYYAQDGDGARAVRVAQSLPPGGVLLGMTSLTARALDMAVPDSLDEGRLLCRHGLDLGRTEADYGASRVALQRALSIAQREQDLALEMRTLSNTASVAGYNLHYQDSLDSALRSIKLAPTGADLYAECLARFWATNCFIQIGDSTAADRHSQAGLAAAERLRDRYRLINALWSGQRVAHSTGNWQKARELSHRALGSAPEDGRILALSALLEFETGETIQGQRYLDRFIESMSGWQTEERVLNGLVQIPAIARLTGRLQGLDDVEPACRAFLSRPNVTPLATQEARVGLALIAILRGEAFEAGEQYNHLEPNRGTLQYYSILSFDRLLGLLSQTMGNNDQAVVHFEDALAFCRKAGYRPEMAWTYHDYTETLIKRDNAADRSKVTSLLDESLAISTELGMRRLMELVAALRERVESRPSQTPAYPDGLTQREVEVLRLVAAGKSNPEIGEELFISPRTVTTHVSNILNKINAANRVEAATYAARQGLA